jgi:predicted ATPase
MELIGRQAERLEVADRLRARRLVTVIGPAGIGKTAVATAVADEIGPTYELGSHYVDLTRIDTPDAVAGAVAAQLGFGSFDALITSPSEQPALVVVDNCEHVTAAAADAIGKLLAACKAPTVLATSRSPLGLPDESLVVLGPLQVPARGQSDEDTESMRLFLERARDAGVSLGDEQLATVAELCRRLDGLPLALELAAARTRVLTPAEIIERLGDGVDVLARPRFRGDRRHRSLAATIEWSYRLLPPEVAGLLDRLGLFSGPFDAGMAYAVAADAGLEPIAAEDALQLLVDSSLVVAEPAADTTRFRLLQTVRNFALQRLREQGTGDEARRRLADHVVAAAAELLASGGRRWDQRSLARLLTLYDIISSTLRWSLDQDDEPDRALMLCSVLWGVVHQGHTDEVAALCEATIKRWPDTTLPFAADAVATTATARVLVGDPRGALELAERTLPDAEPSRTAPVTLRRAMAYAARALQDRPLALALFAEVSTLARDRDLLALALEADVTRAQLLAYDGHLDEAMALAASAQREAATAGSTVNEVWARSVLAHLALRKDIDTGLPAVHDALAAARDIDYPAAVSVNLRSLAWASIRTGDHTSAASALTELFGELIARSGVADVRGALYTTAELLHQAGDDTWATVAASAQALPLVGLTGGAIDELVQLPGYDAVAPLGRREAIALARDALRRLAACAPAADAPTPAAVTKAARFVHRGGFFEIEYAGRSVHAKTGKGLADIARLLAAPGREIHCVELMGVGVDQTDAGAPIDQTARREYEQRIRDLQADVEQAEADNDFVRGERAQVELDAIVEHLAAALGLGGRARQSGGSTERARSAVTQRIRSTIRRLQREHPELARHLEVSVATGLYCAYKPEHPVTWQL